MSALISDLRAALGERAVDTTALGLLGASRDLWPRFTLAVRDGRPLQAPLAVVRPDDENAVSTVLTVASRHGVPVVPLGSGSGVCGGAGPMAGGIVLDLKRLDAIERIDADALTVRVGPGRNLLDLEIRLNDRGLTLGHFPSSIACASVGGAVAARGAGQLSSRYGKIEDMVIGLRVVTPALGLIRTGSLDPEDGPDWTQAFVGAEGTLGVITSIELRVHPLEDRFALAGVRFPSLQAGLQGFRRILQAGLRPSVLRLYDPLDTWMAMTKGDVPAEPAPRPGAGDPLLGGARARARPAPTIPQAPPAQSTTPRLFGVIVQPGSVADAVLRLTRRTPRTPDSAPSRGILDALAPGWRDRLKPEHLPFDRVLANPRRLQALLDFLPDRSLAVIGCEGAGPDADEHLAACVAEAVRHGAVAMGPGPGLRWYRGRYHVSFKLPRVLQSGAFADTMETAAPWSRIHAVYEAVRKAVRDDALVMAHASHAYVEGCSLYFTLVGHDSDPDLLVERYNRTWTRAMDAVLGAGGTLSHHHGVGELKAKNMDREHGDGRQLWERLRRACDPQHVLNPGRLFPDVCGAVDRVAPPSAAPNGVAVPVAEDAIVEVGTLCTGASALATLSGRGHFVPPLGREFLEWPVSRWSTVALAPLGRHAAWEQPIIGALGKLPAGGTVRSHKLPRSATGPSYLPLILHGAGVNATALWLRAAAMPTIRPLGFRFDSLDAAVAAVRRGTRTLWPLLGAQIHHDLGPQGFRMPLAAEPGTGARVWIALSQPDGVPSAAQRWIDHLCAAGGTQAPDDDALQWWEDHWAQAAREGESALGKTGPLADASEIGRAAAVVAWRDALFFLRAVESLCGGPVRALGWIDACRATGCTVRFRFAGTRRDGSGLALLRHQVRETGRSVHARWLDLRVDGAGEPGDYGLAANRGRPESAESQLRSFLEAR